MVPVTLYRMLQYLSHPVRPFPALAAHGTMPYNNARHVLLLLALLLLLLRLAGWEARPTHQRRRRREKSGAFSPTPRGSYSSRCRFLSEMKLAWIGGAWDGCAVWSNEQMGRLSCAVLC